MAEAYIYDAVRTPRGRGKPDGSLHEVSTLGLAVTTLKAIKERNHINGVAVDDVVMGCVDPVGEAGGDVARAAAISAGFGFVAPGVQINRFCASGLDSVNFAAAQIMSGQHDLTIGGGVESMSRVGIGASGGAWPVDPTIAIPPISCRRASRPISSRRNTASRATTSTLMRSNRKSARRAPGRKDVSPKRLSR